MVAQQFKQKALSLWSRLCYGSEHARGLASQRGQAIVEYILILVVVVGIVLGLMHQFSDAFRQYVQGYFGDYLACLLETGEMPSLGGDGITIGICNSQFEAFSLSNGRPMKLSVSEGGGNDAAARAADARRRDAARRRSGSNRNNSARVTRTAATTPIGERHFSGSSDSQKTTKVRKKSSSSKDSYDVPGYGPNDQFRTRRLRMKGRIRVVNKVKKEGEGKEESKTQKKVKASTGDGSRPKSLVFDPKKLRKPAQNSDTDLDVSLGDYLRYLLILGILAAMLIFFGGQFASISKAWEKAE